MSNFPLLLERKQFAENIQFPEKQKCPELVSVHIIK